MTKRPKDDDRGADQVFELEAGVRQLKEDLSADATVNQAIGMMLALGRVTPDKGQAVLHDVAQHTHLKPARVAELVVLWARTGEIPAEIRAELEEALDRHGPTQIPGSLPPESA
ncbi:ANTAR domain-containing protein [Streptomyces chartreusis]|uniref:ANTAR domain-containing protein n=1 Tax=Streptomyces chartreusis TaxID=1969 RepID=UPI003666C09E